VVEFTFTFAFLTVNALDSTSFFGQDEPTTRFMYFSLASLTTLGGGGLFAAPRLRQDDPEAQSSES